MKPPHIPITQTTAALTIKALTILLAAIVVFHQDLTLVFADALQSETASHILAIPVLFAYLLYRKRKMLRAVMPLSSQSQPNTTKHLPTIAGILLATTAILFYWYGSYTFTPLEYHIAALPLFAAGLTLLLFNPQTLRELAFPLGFLILLTPPPSEILYGLGSTLSVTTSATAHALITAVGIPATLSSEYGTPLIRITSVTGATVSLAVDIACSGIYTLIGFLIFAIFITYIIRDKPWKKLALFVTGLPILLLLNIIRLTAILAIGYQYGEESAVNAFHLFGGWLLIVLGTILLLAIAEKAFKVRIFAKPTEPCPACSSPRETEHSFCFACGKLLKPARSTLTRIDVTKIVAIAVSVGLIMSIQAPVFALSQSPPIVIINTPTGQQVSTEILPDLPGYQLEFIYRDTTFEARAKQDMALLYRYTPINQSAEPMWVTIEIAPTRSSLHTWEKCLITWPITHGYQPDVTQIALEDIQLIDNPPIIGRYFVFQYKPTNQTQAVLYWFETTTFAVNTTAHQKHVKISLIAYPDSLDDPAALATQLLDSATAIAHYWQPIKTWSQIALVLSQTGNALATLTTALLAITALFYVFQRRQERQTNLRTYHKLPDPTQQTIKITYATEETTIPTLHNIATTCQNTTGTPTNQTELLQELATIQETGIIKSAIANRHDEPIVVWRTHIAL